MSKIGFFFFFGGEGLECLWEGAECLKWSQNGLIFWHLQGASAPPPAQVTAFEWIFLMLIPKYDTETWKMFEKKILNKTKNNLNIFPSSYTNTLLICVEKSLTTVNGSQLAKMKKSIPDVPLP